MFGLFKKKSAKEKLQNQYNRLKKEAFELSKFDRKKAMSLKKKQMMF